MNSLNNDSCIQIQWKGPFNLERVMNDFNDERKDRGLYQIYGPHPIYGVQALLYIGKTKSTFSKRFKNKKIDDWNLENYELNEGQITIYIGRLAGYFNPSKRKWDSAIDRAEKLLIISHAPAFNTQGIKYLQDKNDMELREACVINWGDRHHLLPEVSGNRWTYKWPEEGYHIFGTF